MKSGEEAIICSNCSSDRDMVIKSASLRWTGRFATVEGGRNASKILTAKRSLRRARRRWEANIRIYLSSVRVNAKNGVDSTQDRDYWRALVNTALTSEFHRQCI